MALGPARDDADTAAAWRAMVRKRTILVAVAFVVWTLGIEARLVFLQVFSHDALVAKAATVRQRIRSVPGRRGLILDRDGHPLAMNVTSPSVYCVPSSTLPTLDQTVATLCGVLEGCDAAWRETMGASIRRAAKNNRQYLSIARHLTTREAERIEALKLPGVSLEAVSRRVYPKRELAAHVLGWVGADGIGLGGIEQRYDKLITGQKGRVFTEVDLKGRPFSRIDERPTAGENVELTLSAPLQHVAETELRAVVREHDAVGGTVIVMDPFTGEILALANEPTFNPNVSLGADADARALRRNRATQEIYEPGSTFKIVTASAAIEEHAFTTDEPIDVSLGAIKLPGRLVKDVHRYGILSFTDVIVKSSNVGAIKIGSRLGQERMGRYVARFGFGRRVCPDLRGESNGMVADPANWTLNSLASISMGYEIGVTPMQMIAAVSSVANGGRLLEPRLVRAVGSGSARRVVRPNELRRTIDPGTIAELTTIMELVVTEGTGRKAQVAGYTVAGKTGTAGKNFPGRGYSKTDYHASFVGFVPSRKPALAILVVVDTPRGPGYPTKHKYYGGDIAAPVFQRVAEQSLRYLAIPPTVNPMPPVIVADVTSDSTGVMTPATASAAVPQVDAVSGVPTIPELRGLGAREAIVRLAKLGLTPHVSGTGLVTAQDPPPGTPIDSRSTCTLRLGRPLAPPPGVPPQ